MAFSPKKDHVRQLKLQLKTQSFWSKVSEDKSLGTPKLLESKEEILESKEGENSNSTQISG